MSLRYFENASVNTFNSIFLLCHTTNDTVYSDIFHRLHNRNNYHDSSSKNREKQTRRNAGSKSRGIKRKRKIVEGTETAWFATRMECVINASTVAPRRIKSLWQAFIVIIHVFAASYILTVVNGPTRESS